MMTAKVPLLVAAIFVVAMTVLRLDHHSEFVPLSAIMDHKALVSTSEVNTFGLAKQKDVKYITGSTMDYIFAKISAASVDWTNYAYVTYANNVDDLCAIAMSLHNLESRAEKLVIYDKRWDALEVNNDEELAQLKGKKDTKISVIDLLLELVNEYGVKLMSVDFDKMDKLHGMIASIEDKSRFYDSYIKSLLFNQTQFDRLVYFSAHSVVQRNKSMDELFFVPPSHVAMPEAYWLAPKNYKNVVGTVQNVTNLTSKAHISSTSKFYSDVYKNLASYHFPVNAMFQWNSDLIVIKPSQVVSTRMMERLANISTSILEGKTDIMNDFFSFANVLVGARNVSEQIAKEHLVSVSKHESYVEDKGEHAKRELDQDWNKLYKLENLEESIKRLYNHTSIKSTKSKSLIQKKIPQVLILQHCDYTLQSQELSSADHSYYFEHSVNLPFMAGRYSRKLVLANVKTIKFNNGLPWQLENVRDEFKSVAKQHKLQSEKVCKI